MTNLYKTISEGVLYEDEVSLLKATLQELADKDFVLEMKDGWTHDDFKKSDEIHAEIESIINKLKNLGINAHYQLGKDIEYD